MVYKTFKQLKLGFVSDFSHKYYIFEEISYKVRFKTVTYVVVVHIVESAKHALYLI